MNTERVYTDEDIPETPTGEPADRWSVTANRVQRREVQRMHGSPQPNRSRIRRRIHRIKVQHGLWR